MKWAALAVRARLQKKRFERWRSVLLQKSHPLFPPWLSIASHTEKVDAGQIKRPLSQPRQTWCAQSALRALVEAGNISIVDGNIARKGQS
jgi:hypothetical protein